MVLLNSACCVIHAYGLFEFFFFFRDIVLWILLSHFYWMELIVHIFASSCSRCFLRVYDLVFFFVGGGGILLERGLYETFLTLLLFMTNY